MRFTLNLILELGNKCFVWVLHHTYGYFTHILMALTKSTINTFPYMTVLSNNNYLT